MNGVTLSEQLLLFDVQEKAGFLGTWLGKPYHGKGYNKYGKIHF